MGGSGGDRILQRPGETMVVCDDGENNMYGCELNVQKEAKRLRVLSTIDTHLGLLSMRPLTRTCTEYEGTRWAASF